MVHRRELDGTALLFGNQGDLFGNAMTWWDHDTGSVWSQPRGEAILGPRKGARLELYPSTLTTWDAWRTSYPETLALDVAGWETGFDLALMSVVVDRGTGAASYSIPALRAVGVVNDVVGGLEVAVVIDPTDDMRWAVFSRSLDGAIVELSVEDGEVVDVITGTSFDPFTGRGLTGPLAGQTLDRIPGFTAFPSDYETFFPDGTIWPP
jgi:hypothetical protein